MEIEASLNVNSGFAWFLESPASLLNSRNKLKCITDSKENTHLDLGSEWVNANFRVPEKSNWESPENLFLEKGAFE